MELLAPAAQWGRVDSNHLSTCTIRRQTSLTMRGVPQQPFRPATYTCAQDGLRRWSAPSCGVLVHLFDDRPGSTHPPARPLGADGWSRTTYRLLLARYQAPNPPTNGFGTESVVSYPAAVPPD